MAASNLEEWVRAQYRATYTDAAGKLVKPINVEEFRSVLVALRPESADAIASEVKKISDEIITGICNEFAVNAQGRFPDHGVVVEQIQRMRPDRTERQCKSCVKAIEGRNAEARATNASIQGNAPSSAVYAEKPASNASVPPTLGLPSKNASVTASAPRPAISPAQMTAAAPAQKVAPAPAPKAAPAPASKAAPALVQKASSFQPPAQKTERYSMEDMEEWVLDQYHRRYVQGSGRVNSINFKSFRSTLAKMEPTYRHEIQVIVNKLEQKHAKAQGGSGRVVQATAAEPSPPARSTGPITRSTARMMASPPAVNQPLVDSTYSWPHGNNGFAPPRGLITPPPDLKPSAMNILNSKAGTLTVKDLGTTNANDSLSPVGPRAPNPPVDLAASDLLLPDHHEHHVEVAQDRFDTTLEDIHHAPLVTGELITEYSDALPQYGFLGLHEGSKLFLNTNVPFSAFICGVQGSGKSHTASCIIENALVPSKSLGRLEIPLSALVFSYGNLTGEGAGLSVSEAAFLAASHPSFPDHPHVQKVTVLCPDSNPALAKIYRKIPNVEVLPFKIKSKNLDIGTMLTLMNVDESNSPPLYLAEVTKILREMAVQGYEGVNYQEFRRRLNTIRFSPIQQQMLKIRLDILESFLDLDNKFPEPEFRPGEVTIMDMSCPFVDATTACVLFNIGLKRYLQSQATGKMIVLDEAHKYMLKNPGAEALNDQLLHTIRLQRHFGARVVVSTQEPTLLTDLIALCSITVVHRFSSPEWFAALKRHIPVGVDHKQLMEEIESLRTGIGLFYSSNAILGKDLDGQIIKGTGKLLKVSVRKRVTADGGASIMAV